MFNSRNTSIGSKAGIIPSVIKNLMYNQIPLSDYISCSLETSVTKEQTLCGTIFLTLEVVEAAVAVHRPLGKIIKP